MAIQKTEAIVLKTSDFRETSLLVTLYTKDFGKIKGIAKGVKKPLPRNNFTSRIEPFSYNDVVFYEKQKRDLHIISQFDLKDIFAPLRQDIKKFAYASYFVELLDSVAQLHDKNEELFGLVLDCLRFLSSEDEEFQKIMHIFEIKFLKVSGFMPRLDSCVKCGNRIMPLFEKRNPSFTTLEKAADFNPVRKENSSNGVNRRSSQIKAENGIQPEADPPLAEKPPSAQTVSHVRDKSLNGVRERNPLTGFTLFSQFLGGLLCGFCIKEDRLAKPILKGTIASIDYIEKSSWKEVLRFKASSKVEQELRNLLRNFLDFHLEKKFNSIEFLEKITKNDSFPQAEAVPSSHNLLLGEV